jgi:hypothetical protein
MAGAAARWHRDRKTASLRVVARGRSDESTFGGEERTMTKILGVMWGVLIIVIGVIVLGWIAYSYTLAESPPEHPWWRAAILVVVWLYAMTIGIKRIRGGARGKASKNAPT